MGSLEKSNAKAEMELQSANEMNILLKVCVPAPDAFKNPPIELYYNYSQLMLAGCRKQSKSKVFKFARWRVTWLVLLQKSV